MPDQPAAPDQPGGPDQPGAPLALPPPRFGGGLPLWYQLAQSLRTAIIDLGPRGATRLPTEVEVARHYGVSLTTVRQALGSLAADRLITRHRRRGTFVNHEAVRSRALRVIGSADAVMVQQASDEVRVLGRSRVPASRPPADRLAVAGDAVLIRRLRLDDGRPVSYAENYLTPEHADRISDAALARAPVTKILRDELSLPLTRIDNAISAALPGPDVASLLRMEPLEPVLISENVTYGAASVPVDVARIYYRGDRFTFAISLDLP